MPDFAFPYVLWLIPFVIAGVVWRWLARPAAIAVSSAEHFTDEPIKKRLWSSRHFLILLEALAAIAFIIALARPQSDIELMPTTREGTDIIIALDYSNSMDAYDPVQGMNSRREVVNAVKSGALKDRLGVARDQIARFVKRRSHDRIGLVVFGVHAYVTCPPTLDHDFLISQVDLLENDLLDMFNRGTNIGGGLGASINALLAHSENRRTIILITDGDNTVDDEVFTPEEAARTAREKGITIHTVGIGGDQPYLPKHLQTMGAIIRFDTRTLEKVASLAGGQFFRAKDNVGFERVMDTIDALERTSRVHPALIFERDLFPTWVLTGFILLAISLLLRYTILQTLV